MNIRWKIPPQCGGNVCEADKGGRGRQSEEPHLTEHRSARVNSRRGCRKKAFAKCKCFFHPIRRIGM